VPAGAKGEPAPDADDPAVATVMTSNRADPTARMRLSRGMKSTCPRRASSSPACRHGHLGRRRELNHDCRKVRVQRLARAWFHRQARDHHGRVSSNGVA
jgi:hypothetical protein